MNASKDSLPPAEPARWARWSRLGTSTRSVAALVTGTLTAQLALVAVAPILSRLFSPRDFGAMGAFSAIATTAMILSAGRYEMALPLAKTEGETASLLRLCIQLSIATSLAVAVVWFSFRGSLGDATGLTSRWTAPLLGGTVMAGGIYQTLTYLAVRRRKYTTIARATASQGLLTAASQTGLGFAGVSGMGLVIGLAIGRCAGMLSLWTNAVRATGERSNATTSRLGTRATMRRFNNLPRRQLPASAADNLGLNLPVLLLTAIYGPATGGSYVILQRSLGAAMATLGQAVGQVYYAEISAGVRADGLESSLFARATRRLLRLAVVPFFVAAVIAPFVTPTILGSAWTEVGLYFTILSPAFLAQLVVSPLNQTYVVIGRQDLQLRWSLGRLIVTVLSLTIPYLFSSEPIVSVTVLSITTTAAYVISWVLIRRCLQPKPTGVQGGNP